VQEAARLVQGAHVRCGAQGRVLERLEQLALPPAAVPPNSARIPCSSASRGQACAFISSRSRSTTERVGDARRQLLWQHARHASPAARGAFGRSERGSVAFRFRPGRGRSRHRGPSRRFYRSAVVSSRGELPAEHPGRDRACDPAAIRWLIGLCILIWIGELVAFAVGQGQGADFLFSQFALSWRASSAGSCGSSSATSSCTTPPRRSPRVQHAHALELRAGARSALGSWGFLRFYLTCGIGAGLAHLLLTRLLMASAPPPVIGASGAVLGVLTAFGILWPRRQSSCSCSRWRPGSSCC